MTSWIKRHQRPALRVLGVLGTSRRTLHLHCNAISPTVCPAEAKTASTKKRSVIRTENQLQAFPSEKFLSRSNQSMRIHRYFVWLTRKLFQSMTKNQKLTNLSPSHKTNFILIHLIGQFVQIVFVYKFFLLNLWLELRRTVIQSWCLSIGWVTSLIANLFSWLTRLRMDLRLTGDVLEWWLW